MRILFVEDDESLQTTIAMRLKSEGYIVDCCSDGASGYVYASSLDYDCIILDILLPELNGLQLLNRLRTERRTTNILMLSAKGDISDRVTALNAGADDYLSKPFAYDELLARIRTITRRTSEYKTNMLTMDGLVMDVSEHIVTRNGQNIELSLKEYTLLEYLLRNKTKVLTRAQILDHVWNSGFEYDSNIVDVYVLYLRNKVDKGFDKKLIHTIRGVGYSMRCE